MRVNPAKAKTIPARTRESICNFGDALESSRATPHRMKQAAVLGATNVPKPWPFKSGMRNSHPARTTKPAKITRAAISRGKSRGFPGNIVDNASGQVWAIALRRNSGKWDRGAALYGRASKSGKLRSRKV